MDILDICKGKKLSAKFQQLLKQFSGCLKLKFSNGGYALKCSLGQGVHKITDEHPTHEGGIY